jgi:two-component system NtrC family sensor kinase
VTYQVVRGKTILVVEDETAVATTLARLLAIDGHRVTIAPDGLAALDRLAEGQYDLILSDIKMPGLDGLGFYREIERAHPAMARRFAFVTGNADPRETQAFLEQSGVPYAVKPLTLGEIRRVVQQVLTLA